MNLKKTILALAVAGTAAAPMMASAAGDGAVWGSMRYGFENADAGGASEAVNQFKNFGSRFGIKGETDLGNGLTAFGKWEAHMFGGGLRDFQIGLKGDFGQLYMGDGINHAWDTFMSQDDTWWYGGTRHLTDGVQSHAATYLGGAGAVQFGVTVQMEAQANNADEEGTDAIEAAIAFDAGPVNIALGMSDVNTKAAATDPEAVIGTKIKGSAGAFSYAFDYMMQDAIGASTADMTSMQIEVWFGNFVAQYGVQDTDGSAASPSTLVLGYTQSVGPQTTAYYEYSTADEDVAGTDSVDKIAAVLIFNVL